VKILPGGTNFTPGCQGGKLRFALCRFRKKTDQADVQPEEKIFNFWVEYFSDACETKADDNIRFPVRALSKILFLSWRDRPSVIFSSRKC
jgi:hypothetical protein